MNNNKIYVKETSQTDADIHYLSDEELEQISDQLLQQYYDVYEVLAS